MVLRSNLVYLSVSLYQTLIGEKILIVCTVGVGWVIHARRSCYPLNFTKTLIRSHTVWNCRSYVVMKLTHSFAAAETCNKVQGRLNRLTLLSSSPIATLVATLSCCFIAAVVNISIGTLSIKGTLIHCIYLYIHTVNKRDLG